jgi:zinc D-Ala-D-Ala carboxypeptidase
MSKKQVSLLFILLLTLVFAYQVESHTSVSVNEANQTTNPFFTLGYKEADLLRLSKVLTEDEFDVIIEQDIHAKDLMPYLDHSEFNFYHYHAYEQIRQTYQFNPIQTINYFNHPHMMTNFYQSIKPALFTDTLLMLVNKNYHLDKDFIPSDLVYLKDMNLLIPADINRNYLKAEVYQQLKRLFIEARRRDFMLFMSSGYRSYYTQESIYNRYILENRQADLFSAKPGHSEHQTGLAVDVTSRAVDFMLIEAFENTLEGQFIKHHAHEFGFIIRYPKEKEHITGYQYEPWHLRYVGVDVATKIYHEQITLEEYLFKYVALPK